MNNEQVSYTVLVAGSERFTDRGFVIGMLDQLYLALIENYNMPIGKVISGNFTGASLFAKEWAEENKIKYESKDFFPKDSLNSFYDNEKLPESVLLNHPAFKKAKDELINSGTNILMAFPNPENELGITTTNLIQLAEISGQIKPFLCNEALKQVLAQKESCKKTKAPSPAL